MKKITTLLLTILAIQAGAQTYEKLLADSVTKFTVVQLFIPVMEKNNGNQQNQSTNCVYASPGDWLAKTDSVYKGNTYKKFYQFNGANFVGLMREDTLAKKVYFIQYCDTVENLLYDFSLVQGGTINYTFTNPGMLMSGVYTVDSVRLKHDYHRYHKHFYLRNHSANADILEIAEGVGSLNHPLFLYYSFNMGELFWSMGSQSCPASQYDEILSCKWNDGIKMYYDSCTYALALSNSCVGVSDTCHYQTICSGIEEFTGIKNISAYPNPASDLVTIEIEAEKQMNLSFSLVSVLGVEIKKEGANQLLKGKNTLKLHVKDLPEGIYLLKFSNGEKSLNKTIMVTR